MASHSMHGKTQHLTESLITQFNSYMPKIKTQCTLKMIKIIIVGNNEEKI